MEQFRVISEAPAAWMLDSGLTLDRLDALYYEPQYLRASQQIEDLGYPTRSLKELSGKINCGATPKLVQYGTSGTVLIRGANVRPDQYDSADEGLVPELKVEATSNLAVLPGDVLYTMSGVNVGNATVYPASRPIASFSNTVARARMKDPGVTDPHFISLFLNSQLGMLLTMRLVSGGVLTHVMPNSFKRLRVPTPDSPIQQAIGNKVRKSERLREIAETRWQAATQLLSQLLGISLDITQFEAFSPTEVVDAEYRCVSVSPPIAWASPADELGAQYFHPRRVRTRRLISQRSGWARLDAVATRQTRSQVNASLAMSRLIGLDQIDSRTGVISESSTGDAEHDGAKVVFRSGSILFSRLRPYLNKVAIWPEQWLIGSGSGELLVYKPNEDIDPHFLFFVLKSPLGLYQVIDVTAGSTHPRVDEDVVDGIAIPRLDSAVEEEIGDHVKAAHSNWYAASALIPQAKADVEALVAGTLDEAALLAEGEEIERWLREHPSPNAARRAT